jgi:GH25 family lysozyme M1 (1,4-beta-N-acetylmuramidase)
VDVSYYQGNFDWHAAKAVGVAFGFARVSDGTHFIDPQFGNNWSNMRAAGVLRGAYQFFEPGEDAAAQANLLVSRVGALGPGDLPAMIDVEATGGQSPQTIAAKIQTWLDIVERGTGKTPFIYSGAYFWQGSVGSTGFGRYPFWIAAYGVSCPSLPNGWGRWTFWQYSDGNGRLDHDVFNGSLAELEAFASSSGDCTPTEISNAAAFGCSCVDHHPNGGFCPGTGCTSIEEQNAAKFGCQCVDHQANGGFCGGHGCTALEEVDASKFGCQCVDHKASGGFCDGAGCTAREELDLANFGCQCVDHKGNGGFCPGHGCTAREEENFAKFGCQCVDHKGNGGFCPGHGCTALEEIDAAKFGCGCVDHKGSGGFCPGTGCTAREGNDCSAKGLRCSLHECVK